MDINSSIMLSNFPKQFMFSLIDWGRMSPVSHYFMQSEWKEKVRKAFVIIYMRPNKHLNWCTNGEKNQRK